MGSLPAITNLTWRNVNYLMEYIYNKYNSRYCMLILLVKTVKDHIFK